MGKLNSLPKSRHPLHGCQKWLILKFDGDKCALLSSISKWTGLLNDCSQFLGVICKGNGIISSAIWDAISAVC